MRHQALALLLALVLIAWAGCGPTINQANNCPGGNGGTSTGAPGGAGGTDGSAGNASGGPAAGGGAASGGSPTCTNTSTQNSRPSTFGVAP